MSNYGKIKDIDGKTTSGYTDVNNINRKANRTGDVQENVGQNKAVHRYTTSGSSIDQARSSSEAKRQAKANKVAPVKTYSPEEIKELEAKKAAGLVKDECGVMEKGDEDFPEVPDTCTSCGEKGPKLKGHSDDLGENMTWWDCPKCHTTGLAVHAHSQFKLKDKKKMKKGGEGQEDIMMKSIESKLQAIKELASNIEQKEVLTKSSLGQWTLSSVMVESLEKAKKTNSVFSMEDAHTVLGMPHADAKAHLHAKVDASSATPENKMKIKAAIEGAKHPKALSGLVSNHVLAAGGEGSKPGELKVLS